MSDTPNVGVSRPDDDATPKEEALAKLRDALSALNKVPAAAVSGEQHGLLVDATENVESLESALTNEVDQLRKESEGR